MSVPKYRTPKQIFRLLVSCFIALACLLAAFPSTPAAGARRYVTPSGGSEPKNGTSWDHAMDVAEFRQALKDGEKGDYWLAAGTYTPTDETGEAARTESFVIKDGIALYGGFAVGDTALSQRDFVENKTILSGAIVVGQKSYHVVYADGAGKTAVLDGFTITGGNANGSDPNNYGGGMYIKGGNPAVANCTFEDNEAKNNGGGMYIYTGSPTITNCTFKDNTTTDMGGGMYIKAGLPTFTNCTFSGNNANNVGGGMYINGASPTLTNCDFSGNSADASGGGMYMHDNSSPTLTNCTFSGNETNSGYGGGMYTHESNPALMNCTFSKNKAANDGDGMYIQSGNPTVINTIFWGEYGTARQVERDGGTLTISYSVVEIDGEGNTDADPQLGPLADNGGPTKTCALLEGSSAIDSGTASGAPKSDQRGVPRPQGGGVDMGAYERVPEHPDSPEVDPGPDSPEGSDGGGCLAGHASPWTLALLTPLAPLALRRRAGRRDR